MIQYDSVWLLRRVSELNRVEYIKWQTIRARPPKRSEFVKSFTEKERRSWNKVRSTIETLGSFRTWAECTNIWCYGYFWGEWILMGGFLQWKITIVNETTFPLTVFCVYFVCFHSHFGYAVAQVQLLRTKGKCRSGKTQRSNKSNWLIDIGRMQMWRSILFSCHLLQEADITCSTNGNNQIIICDSYGCVHIFDRNWEVCTFKGHNGRIELCDLSQQHNLLITIGVCTSQKFIWAHAHCHSLSYNVHDNEQFFLNSTEWKYGHPAGIQNMEFVQGVQSERWHFCAVRTRRENRFAATDCHRRIG